MNCPECKKTNDDDAIFCSQCGQLIEKRRPELVSKQRKAYLIALLFVPIIAIAAFIGNYKFNLPDGVAAVVNGEEIRRSELDAAVARLQGTNKDASAHLRYQVLNELISERLALQEARKAGIRITKEDLAAANASAREASGLDEAAFQQAMKTMYGNGYEKALERRLIISRLISEKVAPRGADPRTASRAMDRWLKDLSGKADVRIALSEQLSGPGCSGCNTEGRRFPQGQGMEGSGTR